MVAIYLGTIFTGNEVATQLLQLRDISRIKPEEPADEYVDKTAVNLVKKFYKLSIQITMREFWRRVAMLGGFLGRKGDGNPGWQTIWYGRLRLQDMCRGAQLILQDSKSAAAGDKILN